MGDKEKKNLTRLSKREILKIMVAQGEEIDKLNARVAELETELAERHVAMDRVGSLAEASLALTKIFQEADEAAAIYLDNVRRRNG